MWAIDVRRGAGEPIAQIPVVREPSCLAVTPNERQVVVANLLPDGRATENTITVSLHSPSGFFPAIAAGVPYHPSHPDMPADEVMPLPPAPVYGVGPWTVIEYQVGDRAVLEPNPLFEGRQPSSERVVIRYFDTESEAIDALVRGAVDIAWPVAPLDSAGIRAFPTDSGPIRVLVINHALAPTDDPTVRRALAAAVDRTALEEELAPTGLMLQSPIPPRFLGAAQPFSANGDADAAAQMLSEAGYTRGEPLRVKLGYPSDQYGDAAPIAMSVVAEQWEATGLIEVELETADWEIYVSQLLAGDTYGAALVGWTVDYYDPHPFVEPFTLFGGLGTNVTDADTGEATDGLSDPQLLDMIDAAAAEVNQGVRADLYQQIQDIWAADVVTIPLWTEPAWVAYREGVSADPDAPFAEALNIGPTGFLDYALLQSG